MNRTLPRVAVPMRWRPTPIVAASMLLHAAACAGLLVRPDLWPWAFFAVVGNHLLLAALGLWPSSTALGPNLTRLPEASRMRGEIAVTFDDGPDPEVTPQVLDLLDRHGVKATFFCVGFLVERHPELCREIRRRGHAVENHSRRHHVMFAFLGMGGLREDIVAAQDAITDCTGSAPHFFRPPAGVRSPLLDPVLHGLDLRLANWTRRGFDTRTGDASRVAARLTRDLAAGDILLLHDGNSSRSANGQPVVLDALALLLDAARERGLKAVTLRHAVES
jgi:peptidoglycan/xylan/chitin deacetylase (PgdA/CDA1 family)